jgi:hypothetical protein
MKKKKEDNDERKTHESHHCIQTSYGANPAS